MVLVDTGPLVALFNPKDKNHHRCVRVLKELSKPLLTTVPVLTEVFHMLSPESHGAKQLRRFILEGGLGVWFLDDAFLEQAICLMDEYADHPMDLADASLVVAAEACRTNRVFTIDRKDFLSYRILRGHRLLHFDVLS